MLPPTPRVAKSAPSSAATRTDGRSRAVGDEPMVPVAAFDVALAAAALGSVGTPLPGSARRGRDDRDAAFAVALEDVRRRMAEAIAVAGLEDGDARVDGVEERRARRRPAAVVRHDEDVASERRAGDDEGRLLVAFDVAGEQHAAAA